MLKPLRVGGMSRLSSKGSISLGLGGGCFGRTGLHLCHQSLDQLGLPLRSCLKYLNDNKRVRAVKTLILQMNAAASSDTAPAQSVKSLETAAEGAITETPLETSLSLERKPSRIGVMETCLVIEEQTRTKTDPTEKATGALSEPELECNWFLLRAAERESRSER
jgi:hypothetical protein